MKWRLVIAFVLALAPVVSACGESASSPPPARSGTGSVALPGATTPQPAVSASDGPRTTASAIDLANAVNDAANRIGDCMDHARATRHACIAPIARRALPAAEAMLTAWQQSDTRCRGRDRVIPAAITNALQRLETALRRIARTGTPSAADLRVVNERGLMPLISVVFVTLIDACNSSGAAPSSPEFSEYPVPHWKRQGPTSWVTSGTGLGPGTSGAIAVTTDPLAVTGPATLHWTSGYEAAYAGSNDGVISLTGRSATQTIQPGRLPAIEIFPGIGFDTAWRLTLTLDTPSVP